MANKESIVPESFKPFGEIDMNKISDLNLREKIIDKSKKQKIMTVKQSSINFKSKSYKEKENQTEVKIKRIL